MSTAILERDYAQKIIRRTESSWVYLRSLKKEEIDDVTYFHDVFYSEELKNDYVFIWSELGFYFDYTEQDGYQLDDSSEIWVYTLEECQDNI